MSNNFVDIQNMSFYRGDRAIYKNISLQIPKGKITAVMGPSGTGKTTLLRLIGGQLMPDGGKILLDQQNVPDLSRSQLYEARKK